MIMTNKVLPVALIAALIGGSVGAFVMHSKNQPGAATETTTQEPSKIATDAQYQAAKAEFVPAEFTTPTEQTAYKNGFADGFRAAGVGASGPVAGVSPTMVYRSTPTQTVYRNAARSSSRNVYYSRPRSRSFWQKHQDKLTVAMGTGGGTLLGALIGGKKGAGIGALAGAGGSALYTYKLRKRNRRY